MTDRVYAALTDGALARQFSANTLQRARRYARGRMINDVQVTTLSPREVVARAMSAGSGPLPYRVTVILQLHPGRLDIESSCSCPVGYQCKHGAALALVLRTRGDRGESWESALEALLSEARERENDPVQVRAGAKGLALQFHLTLPSPDGTRRTGLNPGVRMRPMRTGARRSWIKTGAGWSDVRSATSLSDQDPEQVDVLRSLQAALGGQRHWVLVERPYLDDFGAGVWRDLVRARDSGIHFELARPLAELEILDEPLEVALDLTRDGAHVDLRAGVEHAGTWWTGNRLMTVGRPPHGLALLTELPSRAVKGPAPHRVVLAPLAHKPSSEMVRLLAGEQRLRVPEADRVRFETEHLPRLRRGFTVGSHDGSVAMPEAAEPRLRLTVSWSLPVQADLHWEWCYDLVSGPRAWGLDSLEGLAGLGGLRDPYAERRLLTRLRSEHDLTGIDLADRGPATRQSITGSAAVDLVAAVLPALVAGALVEVVEHDRPDFREATGAPEIRFDTASGEPGQAEPTDWLDLQVRLVIEGEEIPLPDVLAALTLGHPRIVLPSGLHLASDRPEFTALRDLVASAAELRDGPQGETIAVGTHDLGLWAQLADLGIVDAQAQTWVARAQALRDLTSLPRPDPVGVVSTLRSYQLDGFRWLAFLHDHGLGGVLADDMGLGKTLQVLATISHARGGGADPFLVVAPTSVVSAWQSEAARHTPGLEVVAVTASAARRGSSLRELAAGADVVVTTYTLLRLEMEQYAELAWGGLVLDEAQQVKNHQSKTYQAVRRVQAPFKLAVTGTPFENRLMELWSLLSITAPGLYPWPAQFEDQVAKPVEKDGDEDALRRFRQRIRPFLLRRTKHLVAADLPPKQEQVLEVQLGVKHRRVYDTHLQRERQKILGLVDDFGRNRVAIFSSLTRLRQLALDPGLVDPAHDAVGSAKIDSLVEHLHEVVAEGHRALVFSQFTSFLGRVRDRLDREGIASAYLDGTTRRRGEVVTDFREGDAPVFLISLKAGGVGLTLTEADYVFVLDPWWNPATEAQAVDRAHRIGQLRSVMVYRLVATDTIEEKVMELKAKKAELFAQVVDGDGALSTSISADDIRGLFGD